MKSWKLLPAAMLSVYAVMAVAQSEETIRLMCDMEWFTMNNRSSTRWKERHEVKVTSDEGGFVTFESIKSKYALRFDNKKTKDTTRLVDKSTPTAWVIEKNLDKGLLSEPRERSFLWEQRLSLDRNTGLLVFSSDVTAPGTDFLKSAEAKGFCEKIDTSKLKF